MYLFGVLTDNSGSFRAYVKVSEKDVEVVSVALTQSKPASDDLIE